MASQEEFLRAVRGGDLAGVQGMLAEAPDLKNARTEKGVHAAVLAVYYGRPDVADAIVLHGPELTVHDAATLGNLERVKQLVAEDPGLVDSLSGDGFSPLGLAAFTGHLEIAEFLLAQGAEVNFASQDERQFTALTGAVANGNVEVVKLLLMHGADPNHLYEGGASSPLMEAAAGGKTAIVEILLQHGAYVNLRGKGGKSALGLAREQGHVITAEALANAGATE
jgi:ankyrin repeat protein